MTLTWLRQQMLQMLKQQCLSLSHTQKKEVSKADRVGVKQGPPAKVTTKIPYSFCF